ncbi:hypothetical protein Tco_0631769, partial [Tanacetum coccineum]
RIALRMDMLSDPHEWYDELEDGELKDEALYNKAISVGTTRVEEEPSNDAWSHDLHVDE